MKLDKKLKELVLSGICEPNRNRLSSKPCYKGKISLSGFTLIELLVVIAIISLLASVVLVSLNSARAKSRDARRVADMNQMAKALEMFFNDTYAYPTGAGAVGGPTSYVLNGGRIMGSVTMQAYNITNSNLNYFTPSYLAKAPIAPDPQDGSCTSANNKYMYESNVNGSTYTVTFCIGMAVGGTNGGLPAGVRYLTPGGFR